MAGDRDHSGRILNSREERVTELVAQGLTNGQVARSVGTTEHVVKNYLQSIYDKLGLWNRVELALWYEARQVEKQHQSRIRQVPNRPAAANR